MMIKLNRMDLADVFSPEDLVKEIFKQCKNLEPPIPIEELALAAGITDILPLKSKLAEGMLVTDEGKDAGVIFFNDENRPLGRQRFTIGHELGHFLLLHHNGNVTCSNKDVSFSTNLENQIENEANEFAQLILLPENWVQKQYCDTQPSIESLQSTADLFQMSFEATANGCTRYGTKPFAVIYSKDNRVRYCWKDHKLFPFYNLLRKGDLLPSDSQAQTLNLPEQTVSQFAKTPAANWFDVSSKYELPDVLMEQTYFQKDGYKVTLLVL